MTMQYGYTCPVHGSIESDCRSDFIYCPYCSGCREAKRDWRFRVETNIGVVGVTYKFFIAINNKGLIEKTVLV